MKLSVRMQAPFIMGGTFLLASLGFLGVKAMTSPDQSGTKFEQPAGATTTVTSPSPSLTTSAPLGVQPKAVKKVLVAPNEVNDSSTVPSDPSSSPTASETVAPTSDAPDPDPSNLTHGPTAPPQMPSPPHPSLGTSATLTTPTPGE